MKNKIRGLVYGISAMVLTAPALVSAQYQAPAGTGLPESTLSSIISNIMYWLLWAVGIAGVIGFAIAGILYLTAMGDDTRMTRAKNAMLYSIIGVIVALAGLVAINVAQ